MKFQVLILEFNANKYYSSEYLNDILNKDL